MIYKLWSDYNESKAKHVENTKRDDPSVYTVMVRNIPKQSRNETGDTLHDILNKTIIIACMKHLCMKYIFACVCYD